MSQHDMTIADGTGAAVLSDLNNALPALASTSKGPSAPSTPYAGQLWLDDDTPSSTVWTLKQYDGTDWIALGLIDSTSNVFVSKVLPGSPIQAVTASYATYSSYTTQIPADDTIPQNTEGSEVMTATITPRYSTSKLRITVSGFASVSTAAAVISAIFRDATANAVYATIHTITAAGFGANIAFVVENIDAVAAAATTFKLRVGPAIAATVYVNGDNAARLFGGVAAWSMTVEEIAA